MKMSRVKNSETTLSERKIIVNLFNEKKSYSEISKIVKRSKSTVQYIITRYKDENRLENLKRSGRPRKLTLREERKILQEVKKNPRLSAPKLASVIKKTSEKEVSSDTIIRALKRGGFNARVAREKPFVNKVNRKKRIEFVNNYKNKDMNFWNSVVFSDESKFNIFGSDGRKLLWREQNTAYKPQNLIPTVKHGGGGVMVWGCMSANGVGNLAIIDGIMDAAKYMKILKENLKESARNMGIESNYYFQQDNDPKHTAYSVRQWIIFNCPHMLQTPPQSPDLNPIEHLWAYLEVQLRKHEISNKQVLIEKLQEEWRQIPSSLTKKLVDSMPRRLEAAKQSKGYPTKY